MKNKLIHTIGALALLSVITITGCKTTGSVGTDLQGFWNSPAMQTELTTIQNAAMSFLNGFLVTHVGASKSSTAAKDATLAHLETLYPNVPNVVLRGAVDKAVSQHGG